MKEKKSISVGQFFQQFPTDESCLNHLFDIRFGQDYECPKCKRETRWYRLTSERAYSCQFCGHHLHPTVGTLFESSRTPLRLWFYAIYLFTTSRHGVSGKELERQLGVTYKCAYRIGQEIRKHMAEVDGENELSGDVEIDETFLGGVHKGKRGRGAAGKSIIFGMLQRGGEIMTKVIPDVKRQTVMPFIKENIKEGSTVHTDEFLTYQSLGKEGFEHDVVKHNAKEYVKGDAHVNGLENYWKLLKSSIKSTHIHVSKKHMEKYAKEFEFRYNNRKHPKLMFPKLVCSFPKQST